ncbi:DENN domain-containing protein 1C isoform X3 [Macrotis lagotis]|uniref:DENN domain-containing protein 1C isoform X3 n=1 Tax=Macrotis lagotis TaxID=92651 RepID=UPI003D69D05E
MGSSIKVIRSLCNYGVGKGDPIRTMLQENHVGREDSKSTFAWFFEAAYPTSLQEAPTILSQFPKDFCDQELIQMVPKFCFPFDLERAGHSLAAQHFTFVLTDLAGSRRFGFCRLGTNAKSCLCILSDLPWFEVFYKLLNSVGDLLAQNQVSEAEELLSTLYLHPVPGPEVPLGLSLDQQEGKLRITSQPSSLPPAPGTNQLLSCFIAPDSGCLPSIPENRNLTELVVAVASENIVGLYCSLLSERRVLLTASKLSTLTACIHASCGLLYPMHWEHILIPTLPPHLLDYCCAPMPYLIGVHTSLLERVRNKALEDVVILNVDTNTLESPFHDVETLPPDVVSLLKLRLRKEVLAAGDGVSRLFLRAQAVLFGGYRDALIYSHGQPMKFSEEVFLAQKPGPLQAFRQSAIHLQLFKQFIDERLEKLNSGEGFSDLFEQEITNNGLASGSPRSYQLWADNLKKGGGALLHSVKAKTQPAVRNMYRSAKIGLKEVQNRLRYKDSDSLLRRGGSLRIPTPENRSERLQHRLPITNHFGQSRPLRPRPLRSQTQPEDKVPGGEEQRDPLSESNEPWELDFESNILGTGELDLLGEILNNLSIGSSGPESPGLHSSHSMDSCHFEQGSCFDLRLLEEEETPNEQLLSPTVPAAVHPSQGSEEPRTSQTSVETGVPQVPFLSHGHLLTEKETLEPELLPPWTLVTPQESSQVSVEPKTFNNCAECKPPRPVPSPQDTSRPVPSGLRASIQPRVAQLKKQFEG